MHSPSRPTDLSRRHFLTLSASAAAGGALAGAGDAHGAAPIGDAGTPLLIAQAGTPAPLGFNPADPALKYELVIANGDVLDPGAEDARQARHRHPLRPDRGGRPRASRPTGPCSASTRRASW